MHSILKKYITRLLAKYGPGLLEFVSRNVDRNVMAALLSGYSSKILSFMAETVTLSDENKRIYLSDIHQATPGHALMRSLIDALHSLTPQEDYYLLPSYEKGLGREQDRFAYQQKHIDFNIRPGERVLDVGSGAYPFPYATHLADLFEGDTSHRVEPLAKDERPFAVINIEKMPYHDKEFDFVYCSHVLEHVEDPSKACDELMRVGKRGYIETPTRISDIMLNFTKLKGHHKWYIVTAGTTLFFFEWPDLERRDTGTNDYYLMLHSNYRNAFQTLVNDNRDFFVNMLLWSERFTYYVINKQGQLISTNRGDRG